MECIEECAIFDDFRCCITCDSKDSCDNKCASYNTDKDECAHQVKPARADNIYF